MSFAAPSTFNMDAVLSGIGPGVQQLEDKMQAMMQEIQNNPAPSPADLAVFQSMVSTWSNLVQMQSSIMKEMNGVSKQIVNNMGT